MKTPVVLAVAACCVCALAVAGQHDFYKHLRYPNKLVPGVGRNKVEQEGGAGYARRTVVWWPRKGQDIVDVPEGAPLRTWTRNKGQRDREALAGVCRSWTASDPQTFKAHLVGFKGFGTSTIEPDPRKTFIPAAVLRMENGEQRAVVDYGVVSRMLSEEDHMFIHKAWEDAYPRLYATVSQDDRPMASRPPGGIGVDVPLKLWTAASPKFNAIVSGEGAKYPRWAWRNDELVFETSHFHIIARPKVWGHPANWIRPDDVARQNQYRKHVLEFVENLWTYVEASGASMPYWRRPGLDYKYVIHVHDHRAAGGWGHCGIGDCSPVILGHEFCHGQPYGGWNGHFAETMCNAGQHSMFPGELQMFNGNFRFPWRNVNCMAYQSSLWFFVLGDNPNWGYGIQLSAGSLAGGSEPTPYHTIGRLGQDKGLWKNGVRGFGDFFGEYAARMVTCDFVEQHPIRSKYGMPEMSAVYPVYGHANRYRISNAEAPRWFGYNIVRLEPAPGATKVAVNFHGIHDPRLHSDWRACIVAVDGNGRARYSPLWNKGKMVFALRPSDKRLWLTVAATPSAFPMPESPRARGSYRDCMIGIHAPRFPWEATLTGCKPGTPHRRQGDVVNLDELYGRCDSGNTYLNYAVKHEVPIPLTEDDGKLAQEKLAAMLPRIKAASDALEAKIESGVYGRGWYESKKAMMLDDLTRRVRFLQRNAKGHRHPNGGGFVSSNSHVAASAYVGPNAMALDGARVEGNACIKGFAVVLGPKTIVSGNAKIGGRAWVSGDLTVTGDGRILEAATVTTFLRTPRTPSELLEGQATIAGSAVIKGEHFLHLCYAKDQTLAGGVVMDYSPSITNRESGVFQHGRFTEEVVGRFSRAPGFAAGLDAGALYANWQFNQPKAALLEDSYVNNNGILHGSPAFTDEGAIVFNGRDQYAEAPPSVADFGELTVDMAIRCSGGGYLFDFGTGEGECFFLTLDGHSRTPVLTARHGGTSYTVVAAESIPSGRWVRLRVEMDGSTAAIRIDGKGVARKPFPFRPRSVFIGDRPEGNFIACSRKRDSFFEGRMDHFRIYRKVHRDFAALGPPPPALTQLQEWSEEGQRLADAWDGRKRAREAELNAGRYGQLQDEIRKLEQQRRASASVKAAETRLKESENRKRALDRAIHDSFRKLPATVEAEKAIKELRGKVDAATREVKKSREHVELAEAIRACEEQRRELEKDIRERPDIEALSAKTEAAGRDMREAEERIRKRPELAELVARADQEKDGQKKRELREQRRRLFEARRSSDPAWQTASVARQRLGRMQHDALRNALNAHPGREKIERKRQRLLEALNALTTKLVDAHPELPALSRALKTKQESLHSKRRQLEERARSTEEYKRAVAEHAAARKNLDAERRLAAQGKSKDAAGIAARIEALRKEAAALRNAALAEANLLGPNPYPSADAARLKAFQESLKYHTTADWDGRTREEAAGGIPPKMKKWLERVRGY